LTPSACRKEVRVIVLRNPVEMKWSKLSSCSHNRALSRRIFFLKKNKFYEDLLIKKRKNKNKNKKVKNEK
jgi:hypothetical protein